MTDDPDNRYLRQSMIEMTKGETINGEIGEKQVIDY